MCECVQIDFHIGIFFHRSRSLLCTFSFALRKLLIAVCDHWEADRFAREREENRAMWIMTITLCVRTYFYLSHNVSLFTVTYDSFILYVFNWFLMCGKLKFYPQFRQMWNQDAFSLRFFLHKIFVGLRFHHEKQMQISLTHAKMHTRTFSRWTFSWLLKITNKYQK